MNSFRTGAFAVAALCFSLQPALAEDHPFWQLYENTFKSAKYIDLTHAFEPVQPVWPGFGSAEFRPARAGRDLGDYASKGDEFTYEKHGFIASRFGTSPPPESAPDVEYHWRPSRELDLPTHEGDPQLRLR